MKQDKLVQSLADLLGGSSIPTPSIEGRVSATTIELLRGLVNAAEKHSGTGNGDAPGKDQAACVALMYASALLRDLLGWAIDHVYGASIAGISMGPEFPDKEAFGQLNRLPDYTKHRKISDTHVHETVGKRYFTEQPVDVSARRLLLRNLIYTNAGAFPIWLRFELLEALDALENGTTMPLLQPAQKKKGSTEHRKANIQLDIIAFVRFRAQAFGETLESERISVAKIIGKDESTLKQWERRLKAGYPGRLEVEKRFAVVGDNASKVAIERQASRAGQRIDETMARASAEMQRKYAVERLQELAKRLRRLGGRGAKPKQGDS